MLLLELLSRLPKCKHITPTLKFTGLKFLNEWSTIFFLSQHSQHPATVSLWRPRSQNTRSSPYVTLIKPSSSLKITHLSFRHAPPHLWNQLPTSLRIPNPNYSSPSQRPLFEYASFNLLHTAITFHHFFTVSLWAQNLPFQKISSSTLVCYCLSDLSPGCRPFTWFICSSVLCFSSISFYSYVRQTKLASYLFNF